VYDDPSLSDGAKLGTVDGRLRIRPTMSGGCDSDSPVLGTRGGTLDAVGLGLGSRNGLDMPIICRYCWAYFSEPLGGQVGDVGSKVIADGVLVCRLM
jgi:hypothetical protein